MPHAHHVTSQPYGILLILILTAGLYLRGWLRLRSFYQNRIPAWRGGSFLFGIFLIWVAVASPIAGTAHELLTGHMVQHLLLMTFAAPLIWVGEPMIAFMHGMPKRVQDAMAPLLRWRPTQVLGDAITHPAACRMAHSGAVRAGNGIARLARNHGNVVPGNRSPFLVARFPALAELKKAGMANRLLSLPGYVTLRHTFRLPRVLRSRGISRLCGLFTTVRTFSAARPAISRRTYVDCGYRDLFHLRRRYLGPVTFAQ